MSPLNEDIFAVWAPDDSPWSVWVKPVLFVDAVAGDDSTFTPNPALAARYPRPDDASALVLDLPGRASAELGLALATRGYRPVPLYNGGNGAGAAIDVTAIMVALGAGARDLARLSVPEDATPAFLLDSDRMKGPAPDPGRFDNRWLVFPQDFPSAAFLRSRGIRRALVIQEGDAPREDLAHVLLRWQQGGIELSLASPEKPDDLRPLRVRPPSRFRRAWYRALAAMGLRRSNVGGFGALVPVASASSG
jgi:hypothetical protein